MNSNTNDCKHLVIFLRVRSHDSFSRSTNFFVSTPNAVLRADLLSEELRNFLLEFNKKCTELNFEKK